MPHDLSKNQKIMWRALALLSRAGVVEVGVDKCSSTGLNDLE